MFLQIHTLHLLLIRKIRDLDIWFSTRKS